MSAGGAIGSLVYRGRELIDRKDYGRYIQLSLYDGNQHYGAMSDEPFGNWGWNPIQAGSKGYYGAQALELRRSRNEFYVKAYGKEWGETDVTSDVIFETWAWRRAGYFEVHVRATHIGSDTHGLSDQEFPAAYFAASLPSQYGYFGDAPFTAQPIEISPRVSPSCHGRTPTEDWLAYGDKNGLGLILALPPQPYLTPSWKLCTFPDVGYASPMAHFDNPPNAVHDATFYLIPGPVDQSRGIVYDLIPHTTWTFDLGSAEGWQSRSATPTVKNGVLTAQLSPSNFLTYSGLHVSGGVVPPVDIRARATGADAEVCLSYLTTNDQYWDLARNTTSCIRIVPGKFQSYRFEFDGQVMHSDDAIMQYRLSALQPSIIQVDSLAVETARPAP